MSISSFTVRNKRKYKLILLGDQAVGKTCLLERFINDKFQQSQTPTVGIDFVVTNITHEGQSYRLQLWDTAGQERFKSLIPSYLRDSNCGIILYDCSKKQTFDGVHRWLDLYKDHVDESSLAIVVANKIDLKMKFSNYSSIKNKCEQMGLQHFEVSAKTGENIKQLFNQIVKRLAKKDSQPILNRKIFDNSSQSNLQKITQENIIMNDSPNIKLSPRKQPTSTRSLDSQINSTGSLRRKQKCC